MDMSEHIMAEFPYGKLALQKMGPVHENFRIYTAGWLGTKPEDMNVMSVSGAEFRKAKRGPNAGKLSVMVKNTKRTVYVTREEINNFKE